MFIGTALVSLFSTAALAAEPVEVYELSDASLLVMEVSDPAAFVSAGFSLIASDEELVTTHKCEVDAVSMTVDCEDLGKFPVAHRSDSSGSAVAVSLELLDGKIHIFGVASAYAKVVPSKWGWLFGYECEVEDSDIADCEAEARSRNPVSQVCDVTATAEYANGDCVVTCHVDCAGAGRTQDDDFVIGMFGG